MSTYYFLAYTALLATLASVLHAVSTSTLEIDFVFPRNDTYSSSADIPVVFAVQNPELAPSLNIQIYWSVSHYGNPDLLPTDLLGALDLTKPNMSMVSNPYIVGYGHWSPSGEETTWLFSYIFSYFDCNQDGNIAYEGPTGQVVFTSKDGARAPDLPAATSADTCATIDGFAFNVTGFAQLNNQDAATCGVLGSSPTRDPCAVTIDAATVSSLFPSPTWNATATSLPKKSQAGHRHKRATAWSTMALSGLAGLVLL